MFPIILVVMDMPISGCIYGLPVTVSIYISMSQ